MVQPLNPRFEANNTKKWKKMSFYQTGRVRLSLTRNLENMKGDPLRARAAYYSALMEDNKNNPGFLFSTVEMLTESHISVEPCIRLSNNVLVERKCLSLSQTCTDLPLNVGTLETARRYLSRLLYCYWSSVTNFNNYLIETSKLDPIPTRLLEEVLLVSTSLLDLADLERCCTCTDKN